MNKKIIGVVLFAVSFMLNQAVFAHCGEGLKKLVASINLETEQKEKIKGILEQLKSTMKENKDQMMSLRKDINQQVMSDKMDPSVVDGLVDKQTKLIGDRMKAKISAKNQIYNVLTEKQRSNFEQKVKSMEEKIAARYENCKEEK